MESEGVSDQRNALISLLSDDNYSLDVDLLLATDEQRYVPCELISKKLNLSEDEIRSAAKDSEIIEVKEDGSGIRTVTKMAIKYMKRARKTVAASLEKTDQESTRSMASSKKSSLTERESKLLIIRTAAEYYFGDDNLPFDYLSLREFDKTGTFPLSWITTAPKLRKLKTTDEDVVESLLTSTKLEIKDNRVTLRENFTPVIRSIAMRTLEAGKNAHPSPFTVEDAKKLEQSKGNSSKGRQKGKGKGKGGKGRMK